MCDKLTHVRILASFLRRCAPRRWLSLRLALVAITLVPVVAVMAASGYLGMRTAERWGEQHLQDEMALIARTLKEPVSQALVRGDTAGMQAAMSSTFEFRRVYSAHVFDRQGRQIATTSAAAALHQSVPPDETVQQQHGEFGSVAGRDVYSYFVPLTDYGGQGIGVLQITRRASDFREQAQSLRRAAGWFIGSTAVVLVLLVIGGHHLVIGRPLRRLGRSMAAVGSGDREHRSEPSGPRELAALSHTFNDMLDSINATERELSDRRREQQSLEHQLAHAEKMASIGRLASGVAHEVGTPLAVIDGRAQQLERRTGAPEAARRTGGRIRAEVARIARIVEQLLAFGRSYRGRTRRGALAQCARQAVGSATAQAGRDTGRIELEGPEDLEADMDAERMVQALGHLLRNALQAAPEDGHVRLAWSGGGHEAVFTVDDDGPGIPPENRARVLEPFYTTKAVGEGSGLGLAVVHGIAEEHGGAIEILDSPLGGTRVRLRFRRFNREKLTA